MKTVSPAQVDFELIRLGGRTEKLGAPVNAGRVADGDEARKASREFESFLLYYLIKTMRETVQESDLFGNRRSEQVYRTMLDEQIANRLAERGGLGIGDVIYRQIGEEGGSELPLPSPQPEPLRSVAPETFFKKALPDDPEFTLRLEARVSSPFGRRRDPITGENRMHKGIDLAVPAGTPVRAPADGTVVFSGEMRGYGKVVVLRHGDGTETVYGHNRSNTCTEGDTVRKGDVIAHVGMTGRATGPHLHFEVRKGDEVVDPTGYVDLARM